MNKDKDYYKNNKEKIAIKSKERYLKNKEARAAYQKQYRLDHQEEIKAADKVRNEIKKDHNRMLAFRLKWFKAGLLEAEDNFEELYKRFESSKTCERCERIYKQQTHIKKIYKGKFSNGIPMVYCGNCVYLLNDLYKEWNYNHIGYNPKDDPPHKKVMEDYKYLLDNLEKYPKEKKQLEDIDYFPITAKN